MLILSTKSIPLIRSHFTTFFDLLYFVKSSQAIFHYVRPSFGRVLSLLNLNISFTKPYPVETQPSSQPPSDFFSRSSLYSCLHASIITLAWGQADEPSPFRHSSRNRLLIERSGTIAKNSCVPSSATSAPIPASARMRASGDNAASASGTGARFGPADHTPEDILYRVLRFRLKASNTA